MFNNMIMVVVTHLYTFAEIYLITHLVNFIICKLYLNTANLKNR